ncbi:hypothetical protein Tco_1528768 [Tanacetum coccineum]
MKESLMSRCNKMKPLNLPINKIALDASSDGSSGEPRHDYMMSSGAEDDQTGDGHDGYLLRDVVVNLALQKSIALWEFSTKACSLIR